MTKQHIYSTATGSSKLTRRNFATAAAATPFAALPVGASVENEAISDYMRGHNDALKKILGKLKQMDAEQKQSPIQKLFSEWNGLQEYINMSSDISVEEANAQCDILRELVEEILKQQATSKEDLAAQILADCGMGDFGLRPAMVEKCKVLMGV